VLERNNISNILSDISYCCYACRVIILGMIIYYTPYATPPNVAAMRSLVPSARLIRAGSAGLDAGAMFAYALLAYALFCEHAITGPSVAFTAQGKPYFPDLPLHFSLSHGKTHALCVISSRPVGCDVECYRSVRDYTRRRVLSPGDASEDFFAHWTLKESYFKLTGDRTRPFSAIPFTLQGQTAHTTDAYGQLYQDIPNCTAAVVANEPFPRPVLQFLDPKILFCFADKKWG